MAYTNPQYMAEYRVKNRDKINIRQREYNRTHRKKIRSAAKKRHRNRTPEQIVADNISAHDRYISGYKKRMIYGATLRSRKRGWPEPTITEEDVYIPEFCPVLGIKLEIGKGQSSSSSPSLDVVDRDRYYVPSNVAVISQKANQIKNEASVEDLRRVLAYFESRSAA
jgi:hypothetical protein